MMLALAFLALSAQPVAAAPPMAASPAVPSSSAGSPPAADVPGEDTATSLAGLQQMYDQSCAAREYGAYDDLCDQLRQQMKDARAEADREARRHAAEARRHPQPSAPRLSAGTQPATPASARGPS